MSKRSFIIWSLNKLNFLLFIFIVSFLNWLILLFFIRRNLITNWRVSLVSFCFMMVFESADLTLSTMRLSLTHSTSSFSWTLIASSLCCWCCFYNNIWALIHPICFIIIFYEQRNQPLIESRPYWLFIYVFLFKDVQSWRSIHLFEKTFSVNFFLFIKKFL